MHEARGRAEPQREVVRQAAVLGLFLHGSGQLGKAAAAGGEVLLRRVQHFSGAQGRVVGLRAMAELFGDAQDAFDEVGFDGGDAVPGGGVFAQEEASAGARHVAVQSGDSEGASRVGGVQVRGKVGMGASEPFEKGGVENAAGGEGQRSVALGGEGEDEACEVGHGQLVS